MAGVPGMAPGQYLLPASLNGPTPADVFAPQAPAPADNQATLNQAMSLLGQIQNLPADEAYMRHLGVNPVFKNGAEALQLILAKGIKVEFGDMGDSPAHAQWAADKNTIMINQKYQGDTSPETLYAISEALYHEAGHAAGNGDNQSSIQEELNCLSLNTLAHRYHTTIDPQYAQSASTSRLIADGVAVYAKLFFDADPNKQALIDRVVKKYGDLPISSPGHEPPPQGAPMPLAYRVAAQAAANPQQIENMNSAPAPAANPFAGMPAVPNPFAQQSAA